LCETSVNINKSEINKAYEYFIESYKQNKLSEFFEDSTYLQLFPEVAQMPEVLERIMTNELTFYHQVGEDGLDYYVGLANEIEYLSEWGGKEEVVLVVNKQSNN